MIGKGVPQEYGEAAKWLHRAAAQGDPAAQFNLGTLYETGNGVEQNLAEAVKWYRESAEFGYPFAQFNVGVFYEAGEIVPQDFTEAVNWYRRAAEQGLADAQCNLGLCYRTGRGVEQDSAAAVKWFIKAAEQGNSTAQFNLGFAYDLGEGVPQNYVEAYKWANLANAAGMDGAKELRDALAQQMTPSQIEDGQRLASIEALKIQNPTNHAFQERQERAAIPSDVRREVWRRDGGVCVKCGGRRNLEYDHIVPVSKGGSNTARNIELLCEACNRSKSASIQ
jgi:TPR repeat protein